jgi:hypothetical protein
VCAALLRAADTEPGQEAAPAKEPFRVKNRMVELGISAKAEFANDFITAKDFFRETLVIDLDNFKDGLNLNAGAAAAPFYLNFNWHDNWGFGLFTKAEASGNAAISGNMLTLSEAENEQFGVGAAIFVETGAHAFFHIKKFKVKIRTAGFYPVIYTEPDISYTFRNGTGPNGDEVTAANLRYNMLIYSAFPMETKDRLTAQIGVDLGAGVEYPLLPYLDLGMDITHIPLVPAVLRDYMQVQGVVGIEETSNVFDIDMDSLFSPRNNDTVYGTGNKKVIRPFKTIVYTDYRPFKNRTFALVPSLGFSYNPLYVQPFAPECGLGIRLDLANIFIATLGVHYDDRLWKNSIDFALNCRAIELDIGIGVQSQDFVKSWQGGGLAASVGLKLGW